MAHLKKKVAHDADDVDDSDNANDPHYIENADDADDTDNADGVDDADHAEDADHANDTDKSQFCRLENERLANIHHLHFERKQFAHHCIGLFMFFDSSCRATKITMIAGFADTKH